MYHNEAPSELKVTKVPDGVLAAKLHQLHCHDVIASRCILLLNHSKTVRPTADHSEEDALIFTGNVSPGHAGPQLTGGFVFGQLNVGETNGDAFFFSFAIFYYLCQLWSRLFASFSLFRSLLLQSVLQLNDCLSEQPNINSFQTRHIFLLNHSKAARPTADHSEEDALIFTGNISPGHAGPQLTGGLVFGQLNVGKANGDDHGAFLLQPGLLSVLVSAKVFSSARPPPLPAVQLMNWGRSLAGRRRSSSGRIVHPPSDPLQALIGGHLNAVIGEVLLRVTSWRPLAPIILPLILTIWSNTGPMGAADPHIFSTVFITVKM
ncbi:hypothetical protein TYRP_005278 [Tyrophagus putrescentiae]|nr:hypothetical protein TYRP_005278 [Tyrophagus putrescentiae]